MPRTTKIVLIVLLGLGVVLVVWIAWRFLAAKTPDNLFHLANTSYRNTNSESDLPRVALTMTTKGGDCVYGGCNETLTLYASGQYRITRRETDRVLQAGTLPSEKIVHLLDLIASTDYSALRMTPFTGVCPTAYDGFETTYTFVLESGQTEVLDTCKYVLDFDQPLLREMKTLPTSS